MYKMYCWDLRVSALWTDNQGPDFQKNHTLIIKSSQIRHNFVIRSSQEIVKL